METALSHFRALIWKNWLIELGSFSKIAWNLLFVVLIGLSFSKAAALQPQVVVILLFAYVILQCGFVGRMNSMNLIRDRQVKFRLTLQLIGVKQSTYLVANYVFTILYGIFVLAVLVATLILFSGSTKILEGMAEIMEVFGYTILFFMAYLSMCAAFSALINQLEFGSEIIGKFTFLSVFIPIAIFFNDLLTLIIPESLEQIQALGDISPIWFWLPNISFLKIAFVKSILQAAQKQGAPIEASYEKFVISLVLQFVGFTILYVLLDRYVSSDTGGQRQIMKTAPEQLDVVPELLNDDLSSENLRPGMDNVIRIRNLTKKFGDFTALHDLNMDITPNKVTCLLGHNGAGKTTLIDIMTGFKYPTAGGIYLGNTNIHTNLDTILGKIGYASSHDPLFEELEVMSFLLIIAKLKCLQNPEMAAIKALDEFHLREHMKKLVKECSGGTRRRISIATAFIGDPSIVFLDEPSTGVDPENRRALWKALSFLKRPDRVILLTTHHLEEAEFLSEDVIILAKGQMEVRGSPDEIKTTLGVGYKMLLHLQPGQSIEMVLAVLKPYLPYFELNAAKYETLGEIKLEMKRNTTDLTEQIMGILESQGIQFTLDSSTLEDAFIHIGESHETGEVEIRRVQLIDDLFHRNYQSSDAEKFVSLLARKFKLLFNSLLQVLIILMLITIPSLFYNIVTGAAFRIIRRADKNAFIGNEFLYLVNLFSIIYYTFSCGFFGITPMVERISRIRYLMKMNNVGFKTYYPSLFLPDLLIGIVLVVSTYAFVMVLTKSYYQNWSTSYNLLIELAYALLSWMVAFITQSYAFGFLFNDKTTALKRLVQLNIGLYFICLFIVSQVAKIFGAEAGLFLLKCFYVLVPGYLHLSYSFVNLFLSAFSGTRMKPYDAIYFSLASLAFYFSIAIYLDYRNSNIQGGSKEAINPNLGENPYAIDRESIAEEKRIAFLESSEFPIQTREVAKNFGAFWAIKGVSIAMRPKEILGLIGPNGAGKSTMFNLISNFMGPSFGQIIYNGKSVETIEDFYDKTGLCAQDDIIWPELSVDAHLYLYAKMKGVDPKTVEDWKELMGLSGFGNFASLNLSTGMKRKLCYIISMMANPAYKFLDEPTSGLDPMARKLMRRLVMEQKRVYGGSCVFTTHTMTDAEDMCDRIAILVNGQLSTIDTVSNLRKKTVGMNVSFMKDLKNHEGVELQRLCSLFADIFPESLVPSENPNAAKGTFQPLILQNTERKVVFSALDNGSLVAKFKALNQLKTTQQIPDFEITKKSLEDLFLAIAKAQGPRLV